MILPERGTRHRGPGDRYRPDIDGLRAVAVVAVILFHFDVAPFSGGFVGVDVFFVISGYLITSIVDDELRGRRFSILTFYERRLRRIAPALLTVVLASAVLSPFVFLPGDLRPVGASLMQAALFTSNVLFYSIANDYFAADNLDLTPVLHSWSLSVEAQFYLVYPWLLLLLNRRAAAARPVLAGLAVLSFAGAAWGAVHAQSAAFYLLPPRAWELLLGGLLALLPLRHAQSRVVLWAQGLCGLGLIAFSVFAYTRQTTFPGAAALLPCCGAALLIRAGCGETRPGGVTRWLSATPLVFVGRISYSLYLWHWPLLVFASYGRNAPLGWIERLTLIGLSVLLAILSWRFIERPFLSRAALRSRRALFAGAALATVLVVGASGIVEQAGQYGFAPQTLPAHVLTLANGQYDSITGDCGPDDLAGAVAPPCRFGAKDKAPTVLLWGNSYARMWTPTLDIDAKAHDVAGVSLLLSKCLPLLGVAFPNLPGCEAFNDTAIAYIRAHPALRTVILGANWFVAGPGLADLDKGLAALRAQGVKIVVLLAPPQPGFSVPRTLAMAALRHEPPPAPIDEAQARAAQRGATEILDTLRETYGFTIVDPFDKMCDGTSCALDIDGHAVFFDAGHVSLYAARRTVGLFDPVFRP